MPRLKYGLWKTIAVNRLRIGLYALHINRWLSAFPREQCLFIRMEDYSKHRAQVLNEQIFPFLGLPPMDDSRITNEVKNHNAHGNQVEMLNKTRLLLKQFHEPFNKKLAELLNDERWEWSDIS